MRVRDAQGDPVPSRGWLAVSTAGVSGQSQSIDETTRLAALGRTWGLLNTFIPTSRRGPPTGTRR